MNDNPKNYPAFNLNTALDGNPVAFSIDGKVYKAYVHQLKTKDALLIEIDSEDGNDYVLDLFGAGAENGGWADDHHDHSSTEYEYLGMWVDVLF